MQTEIQELRGYQHQIQEITSAPVEILPILERIMRTEIFHSTLDWQSARQFSTAAKKALKMYQEARIFYDADHTLHAARWKAACAETELTNARQMDDATKIAEAEAAYAAAESDHDRAHQNLLKFF